MKKFLKRQAFFVLVFSLGFSLFLSLTVFASSSMEDKLSGKILLQVENNGEAWYVSPKDKTRSFLGRPEDAFSVMREQGVGISNDNLNKIPVSLENLSGEDLDGDGLPDMFEDAVGTDKNKQDSDGDSYNDKEELQNNYNPLGEGSLSIDKNFQEKQKGKIFLQVENNGEAWYVSPQDGKRHFLGRPNDAFSVMRNQGLGISNTDLEKISVNEEVNKIDINDKQFSTYNKLIDFAKNITSDCSSNDTIIFNDKESDSPDFDYKITTKGKNDNFCNMQIEILNVPELENKKMTCDFETIMNMSGSTEDDYYTIIEFLPMIITLGAPDKEFCQGDLTEAFDSKKYEPISKSDFKVFTEVDSGLIYDISKDVNNNIYYLKQEFANNQVDLYKYDENISLIDNSDIEGKNSLFIDSQNSFYTWDGVAGFSEGNGGLYKYDNEWKEMEKFSEKQIISVAENNEGLWVATPDVLYLQNKSNTWIEYMVEDWGGNNNYSIKVVKGNGDYLLFQAGFDFYMYKDGGFEKLNIDNLDILHDMSGNVYIKDNIAWFYSTWFTGGRGLVKMNLDDYSFEEYLISSPEDGVSNDIMVIDSIVSGDNNDFWFLSHNYNNTDVSEYYVVISHYENNTLTHTKYDAVSGDVSKYADTLIFRDNNLYVLFGNGLGLYKV